MIVIFIIAGFLGILFLFLRYLEPVSDVPTEAERKTEILGFGYKTNVGNEAMLAQYLKIEIEPGVDKTEEVREAAKTQWFGPEFQPGQSGVYEVRYSSGIPFKAYWASCFCCWCDITEGNELWGQQVEFRGLKENPNA